MTPSEQVAHNIYDRENMPVPKDIGDGAGVTQIGGQTAIWLKQWNLKAPTDKDAAIENIQIWLADTGLVQVCHANLPLGDCVSDWAYASDPDVAIRAMQTALGGLVVDGRIGMRTLAALVTADYASVTEAVAEARIAFLKAEVAKGAIKPAFEVGLINRAQTFLT